MEEFHSANLYWKYYQFHIPNSKKQCFSMKTFDCVGIHTFCLLGGGKRENIRSEKKSSFISPENLQNKNFNCLLRG